MRVLLTSQGSTGDIYPLIAYGRALREAGHSVSFATASLYRTEIEAAGLTYLRTPPDWSQEDFADFMRQSARQPGALHVLRRIYRACLPSLRELLDILDAALAEHDVLVSSYLFPFLKPLADRRGMPFALFGFCHNTVPNQDHPPEPLPRLPLPSPRLNRCWNRLLWRISDAVLDRSVNGIIGRTLTAHGLPRMRHFFLRPAECCIVAVSPALMKPQGAVPGRFHFTGYLRWQTPPDPIIETELAAFCADEEVPVLTFGSVAFDEVDAVMGRFARHWPVGHKIIVQSGWAGLCAERGRPEIRIIGKVSHDQLFRHASCVIHHGGAGTTASVLHAGKPQVVVPHIADQPFWAAEVARLGCGVSLKRRTWPEQLPQAVARVTGNSPCRANAERSAAVLRGEHGRTHAVSCLERFVAEFRPNRGEARPAIWT